MPGHMLGENLVLALNGQRQRIGLSRIFPVVGTEAVIELRVNVFRLHHAQSLVRTQVVTLVIEADIFQGIERQSFLVDRHAPGHTQAGA